MRLLVGPAVAFALVLAACSSSQHGAEPRTTTTVRSVPPNSVPALPSPPPYRGRTPAVRVLVSKGCPSEIRDAVDVNNPSGADWHTLLPDKKPTAGLMCAFGPEGTPLGSRLLSPAEASTFATAINRVQIKEASGLTTCPPDSGRIYVLAFAYADVPDADLWWHATGCQFLDNGTKQTIEGGNPSFYNGFDGAAQQLHA